MNLKTIMTFPEDKVHALLGEAERSHDQKLDYRQLPKRPPRHWSRISNSEIGQETPRAVCNGRNEFRV